MPYRQVWFDAPKDASLPVYPELPPEYRELSLFGAREAVLSSALLLGPDRPTYMHYCDRCGGWVPGLAHRFHESTLGLLSGRDGEAHHCARCGRELAFVGIVS